MRRFSDIVWLGAVCCTALGVTGAAEPAGPAGARLIEKERIVEAQTAGSRWMQANLGQFFAVRDKLRTGLMSRMAVRLTDLTVLRYDAESTIEIEPPRGKASALFYFRHGTAYFYSRERAEEILIRTPAGDATIKGTEFVVQVGAGGKTTLTMFDGVVELSNVQGRVLLRSGEQGEMEIGKAPHKTAMIAAKNVIQWCLYYPGVLDIDELRLSPQERLALRESIEAYRAGDLLGALARHPQDRDTGSPGAMLFRAAVTLSVGQVDHARALLARVPASHPGRRALEKMIAAVNLEEWKDTQPPSSAGEWVAESYYQQSRFRLEASLEAARHAARLSPGLGFAWVRVAELEFSFGRTGRALDALKRGLVLAPRNAQAHALQGFLLAAQNRIGAAHAEFEQAIALDGALGNAWLGRGLCSIRKGDDRAGRLDLQVAAVLEPNRSILRSYLGKAFSQTGIADKAHHELARAEQLDPHDPTPWLYSAIQNKQQNRYNEAIEDLQESLRLNDYRLVYRSRFLLDEDRAVRSANLARIYQNNGLTEVAVREATRAVESDYANPSAHLFLANSFDALRDPTRIALRYETAWFNELLLSHLLSPVGGGPLSHFVSQHEYSKLLEADGLGGASVGEWRSDGRLDEKASVFGTFGNFSFGLDFAYFYDNGRRPNNAVSREEAYWQAKYQVTPSDIFYTFGQWQDNESGDLFQSYNNLPSSLGFDFEEKQAPGQALVGWNHRWAPGVNTLLLGGRLAAEQLLTDPMTRQVLLGRASTPALDRFLNRLQETAKEPLVIQNPDDSLTYSKAFLKAIEPFTGHGLVTSSFPEQFSFATLRQFEIYSGEVQHLWETDRNTLILGGRWQSGKFETDTRLTLINPSNQFLFSIPAAQQHVDVDFERLNGYVYDFVKVRRWLTLIGGASWDQLEHPLNFRNPPVSGRTARTERWSGKAGFTLSPSRWLTIRGLYAEALGGVTFEDSLRLEPVQLAGFNQSYRTIISESLAGAVEAPVFENWGISIEGTLPTKTWWGASFQIVEQDVERTVGAFDGFESPVFPAGAGYVPGGSPELLAYREEALTATLNQLIGREFALGAAYRYTRTELRDTFPQLIPIEPNADRLDKAVLHEVLLSANWNSPTGLFARAEARWYSQELDGAVGGLPINGLPGDDFWQFNLTAGYRFYKNQCEVSCAVLNLTGEDYHLSPLSPYNELPRDRTFLVRVKLNF